MSTSCTNRWLTSFLNRMAKLDRVDMFAVEEYTPRTYGAENLRVICQVPVPLMKEFCNTHEPRPGTVFGLASYVNLQYDSHMPMFDIDSRYVDEPEAGVMEFAGNLQEALDYNPVHILKTTHGFHVLGEGTMPWIDYEFWLGSDIVDKKFAQWSIDRGYGTLRFTAGGVKTGIPKLWRTI